MKSATKKGEYMKQLLIVLTFVVGSAAQAFDVPNVSSGLDQLMENSTEAVYSYAVNQMGLSAAHVSVSYDYGRRVFLVSDAANGCSFQARTRINWSQKNWKVMPIAGTNTCS
jgi:hypothetical protein